MDRSDVSCQDFVRTLADFCDRTLPAADCRRSEAHVAACADCARYLRDYEATIRLSSDAGPPDDKLPEDLVRAILAARSRTH